MDSMLCTGLQRSPASSKPYWSTPGACCEAQEPSQHLWLPISGGEVWLTKIEMQTSPFLKTGRGAQLSAQACDDGARLAHCSGATCR